jgi:GAF domain-containing protein/CheY-like chemotaxis protein
MGQEILSENEVSVSELKAALNQRSEELAVINSVQEALSKKMDMQGIYNLVGNRIRDLFNAQVVLIATFDHENEIEIFNYNFEMGKLYFHEPRPFNKLRKHLIETKQLILINENADEAIINFGMPALPGTVNSKSMLFMPLIVGDIVSGYVSLQNIDQENAFSESDVRLLSTLANSMSVALENARLFDETNRLLKETEQSKAELAVINSVQEGLVREMDLQGIYNLVGNRIRDLFNAQVVSIATFDHINKLEHFNYYIEKGEISFPAPRNFDKVRQHLIQTGQNILINENAIKATAEFGMKVIPGTEMPKSVLFMPMKVGEKVTGYVSLQNIDQEHAFSFSDVRLLSTLSNSMSVALQNANLFDETNRLLKETEQQKGELAVINSVQEGLAKALDMQAIYDLVGNRIRDLFDAQVVGIATFDHQNQTEHVNYLIEKGERYYPAPRPLNILRKHLIESKEKILINKNFDEVAATFGVKKVPGTGQPKSALYVPLVIGEKVTGYTTLQNLDKENAFSDSDVRLLETLANTMGVALENARLFDETNRLLKETEQQKAELGVINSVQEGLAKELDMQAIYDLVGDRIRELFNAQVVMIATFDHETATEHFKYMIEDGQRFYPNLRPYDKLRQQMIITRQKIVINTNYEEAFAKFGLKILPGTNMTKSGIFVPLVIGDKVNSYISLQNNEIENAFSESDIRLLETLANSMSVALENARLFDETNRLLKETEQRTAELAVINSVQEGLAQELNMQGIYNLVGDRVQKLFNAQTVLIASFDHDNKMEHFHYTFEKGELFSSSPRALTKLRELLIDERHTIYIETEKSAIEDFGITPIEGTEMPRSLLFVPLMAGTEIRGYVSLQNIDKENAFSNSDIRLLETLANSMSVALENARLFDETNRLLKETEQRTHELAIINSVQEGLASKLDIQAIYDLVGDKIRDVFDADGITISYFNEETNYITHPYYLFKGKRIEDKGFEYGKGLTSRIISTGQALLINENALERFKELGVVYTASETEENTARSWLGVPLISGGKVKGTIRLENYEKEFAYSDSDLSLLQTLANSISVALENARLFDETNRLLKETEQRTAELAVINSVQEGLAHELDMQGIYDLVGDRVQKLFSAQAVIIASFDLTNNTEHFNYLFENDEKVKAEPRPINKLRQLLIDKKQSIYIPTAEQAINEYGLTTAIGGTQKVKTLLFVPLLTGNIIRGYVSLQNIDIENAFSESDIRLLETLANSMSVALENARLFDETSRLLKETEQRTAELAVINSVQEGLAKELDMKGIYDLVGDRLCELFPDSQTLVIRTFDHESSMEHWQYSIEKGIRQDVDPRPLNWNSKLLIGTKKPLDIQENYVEVSKQHGGTGVTFGKPPKSAVFVPMLVGEMVKGSISLQNVDTENAFTESDLRLLTTITNSMSVALENARLFDETNRLLKETEQRTAELGVINSVQEGLVREIDMQAIYETIGERLCSLFNIQTVVIRTFDHEAGIEHWQYAKEKGERQYIESRQFNWNSRLLIETKMPLDIRSNYVEVAKQHGSAGVTFGNPPKSAVFVPMIVGDVVKGSVSLQNVDSENAFSDSDVRLLTTIVNSMSVALENARLFDETNRLLKETEQRTAELGIINGVQEGLASKLDIKSIYELVGDKIRDVFDTQGIAISHYDRGTNQITHPYYLYKGNRVNEPGFEFGKGLTSHVIKTGQPLLINQNAVEKFKELGAIFASAESEEDTAKSWLSVPVISGGQVNGTIRLENYYHEFAYSDSDVSLLQTLANSMSVALENARLFDETTHLLAEAKQRATELSTVNSISKAVASQLDADELIQLVGDQIKDLFNANIVYLALLNSKTKTIHFPYQYGDDNQPLKLGEGLTSKIIITGEPLLVNKDIRGLRAKLGIAQSGKAAASYLGVPIPVGEEIIGVLSVQSTEHENQFNENDLRLLSTIASSVGVALNNATLFEDVKLAKMEAEAASKAAEKANEAKSAFLSTVSHELRTPLTSVLGFAKIIRKRLDEKIFPSVNRTDPKTDKVINQITENLGVVISEGERLTHLINDVLDLAKIEAGKMEWNFENVSMAEVAERAIAATTSLFDQKLLTLEKNIDDDLPNISGDRDKLIQVIINLISNSVKFTDEGSVKCKVYKKKNELIVSISDTGIGIAPEDHAAVYEQFKQVGGDTLTDKPKGTGLGLPICKEIVEHHGGRIWLESKPGKGSTFSFALPLLISEPSVKPVHLDKLLKQLKEQMAQSTLQGLAKNSTILIVDDDDSIRSLLHQELSDAGYLIDEAANGKQALESVRKNRPDLIILDIMMPEMNGFDVAAILKNDPQTMDIPIIVLSIVQDKTRGFRIGVDRYLTKPIDTAQLFAEVGTLLEQGKSRKKVMVVDEDTAAVSSLTEVLETKGYNVVKSNGKGLVEKAISDQPDIIILNSIHSDKQEVIQTLRFEKGLENVLFLIYQ